MSLCLSSSGETFMWWVPGLSIKLWASCGNLIPRISSWKQKYIYSLQGGTVGVICLTFQRLRGKNSNYYPWQGFQFVVPINAFMTTRCTKAGSVWRIRDLYSALRPALKSQDDLSVIITNYFFSAMMQLKTNLKQLNYSKHECDIAFTPDVLVALQ